MSDDKTPRWQKITAACVAVLLAVVVALTWDRLGADFWPLDRSFVGPNLVASVITWAIVLIAGALIWPPTRRRLHRFMDRKLAAVHEKLDAHAGLHQAHADSLQALHDKLDKLLDHPKEKP